PEWTRQSVAQPGGGKRMGGSSYPWAAACCIPDLSAQPPNSSPTSEHIGLCYAPDAPNDGQGAPPLTASIRLTPGQPGSPGLGHALMRNPGLTTRLAHHAHLTPAMTPASWWVRKPCP